MSGYKIKWRICNSKYDIWYNDSNSRLCFYYLIIYGSQQCFLVPWSHNVGSRNWVTYHFISVLICNKPIILPNLPLINWPDILSSPIINIIIAPFYKRFRIFKRTVVHENSLKRLLINNGLVKLLRFTNNFHINICILMRASNGTIIR